MGPLESGYIIGGTTYYCGEHHAPLTEDEIDDDTYWTEWDD